MEFKNTKFVVAALRIVVDDIIQLCYVINFFFISHLSIGLVKYTAGSFKISLSDSVRIYRSSV